MPNEEPSYRPDEPGRGLSRGEPDPIACRVSDCPMTAQACELHRPDPQVGDEVVLRGIVTQRAIDSLGRDIVQVTRGRESYWFARADHAEPADEMMVFAACPICDQTWSESVPDIGDRTRDLIEMVARDCNDLASHCRTWHGLAKVTVGFIGLTPNAASDEAS